MAIDLQKLISCAEDLEVLTYKDLLDENVYKKIWRDLNDPQYYNEPGRAIEFSTVLENTLKKNPELANKNPDLFKKYNSLITLLRVFAIPALDIADLHEIFRKDLSFSLKNNIDLMERVNNLYLAHNFFPPKIRDLRRQMLNGMRRNNEKIGSHDIEVKKMGLTPPYIRAWLVDYITFFGIDREHNSLDQSTYITQSKKIQRLNEEEKRLLFKVIQLYDYLLVPVLRKEYRPYEYVFPQERHLTTFMKEEEETLPGINLETLENVEVEAAPDGITLSFGTMPASFAVASPYKLETKEKVVVKEKVAVEKSPIEILKERILKKQQEDIEGQKSIYQAENRILANSGQDYNKIKSILIDSLQRGNNNSLIACLFILSRVGEFKNLIKDEKIRELFKQDISRNLQSQKPEVSIEQINSDFENNIDNPIYSKILLKFLLMKAFPNQEEKSALYASRLESIFRSLDQNEYLGLAYYDMNTDKFEWAKVKFSEKNRIFME